MSTNFAGVTFSKQKVTPSHDAIVRRAILTDGTLTGCEMSYSGSTLTMVAGQLMICGRQIVHPSAQNWAVTEQTSGFARLVISIDLTRTSTKDTFDQVLDSIQYATSKDGFAELEQTDINTSGTKYQVAACVVSLGPGGITGIVSQLEKSEGGGAGLNFKVVGGDTQPASPTENTIWVSTDVAIPSWAFSATEPGSPVEGMAWICTGAASLAPFNALTKMELDVYPLSAAQYIDGVWTRKNAQVYVGGLWKVLEIILLSAGGYIGEWAGYAYKHSASGNSTAAPTVSIAENGEMTVTWSKSGTTGAAANNMYLDFDGFQTLKAEMNVSSVENTSLMIMDKLENNYTRIGNVKASKTNTWQTITIDVSNKSQGYVGVWGYADGTTTAKLRNIQLE